MISNTSASVYVEHLQVSEVPKVASLVARLKAKMDMSPNSATNTQDVDIHITNNSSDSTLAALVLCAAALNGKSPEAILEDTRKILQHAGFAVDSKIGSEVSN